MTVSSVHWHEGMFLWPQQMQHAERFVAQQVHHSGTLDTHYNWGLRTFEVDLDALGNFRFVTPVLSARLRDGTLLEVPEDAILSPLDVKVALERESFVTVFLAIPKTRQGKPNVTTTAEADADDGAARFRVEKQDLEDENTGEDSQPLEVRRFNVKLLTSTEDIAGYETLPVARLKKSNRPGGKPELDQDYIPPILACDAWQPLRNGILQAIYDRFGRKITKIAAQVVTRGISFDTRNAGDALLLGQLHSLNEAYAFLRVLAFAEGVHPLKAYLELCRLAGKLAIFEKNNPRAPSLPHYDHDDLGGCFYAVKRYLDSIEISEPVYEERPFVGADLRMEVALEPKWLEPLWEIYVGVHSPLKADDCIRLLTKPGQLDMKIGSASRVDEIFDRGSAGLKFSLSSTPPRALPSVADLVYFQVSRESHLAEWQHVQKSLTLAIRLNQARIAGNIQGQQTLTIKTGGQTTTMRFVLYLVPREV